MLLPKIEIKRRYSRSEKVMRRWKEEMRIQYKVAVVHPSMSFIPSRVRETKKIGFFQCVKISFQFILEIVFLYGYINSMRLSYSCHISSPNARKFYVRVPNDMHMPIYGNIKLLRKDAFQLLCLKSQMNFDLTSCSQLVSYMPCFGLSIKEIIFKVNRSRFVKY